MDELDLSTKTCVTCRKRKPLRMFWRDRSREDGRLGYCIECASVAQRAKRAAVAAPRPTREQRFWSKVDLDGPVLVPSLGACWVWVATRDKHGYGWFDGKAHRASWELAHGAIPPGICVLHKCDHPPCVRPEHLFLGTKADNTRDMVSKGRARGVVGIEHHNAKLTNADVIEIRRARAAGESVREISARFGISGPIVYRIMSGKRWSHV